MSFPARILGAMAVVLAGGVAGGAVIGKVPPMKQLAPDYALPQAGDAGLARSTQRALPDHYPIITPEGRFEVYELSDRGLYRTARYADLALDDPAAELDYGELDPGYADAVEAVADGALLAAADAETAERVVPAGSDTTSGGRSLPGDLGATMSTAAIAPASLADVAGAPAASYRPSFLPRADRRPRETAVGGGPGAADAVHQPVRIVSAGLTAAPSGSCSSCRPTAR